MNEVFLALIGAIVGLISAGSAYIVSRRRPDVDIAGAADSIVSSAREVMEELREQNARQARQIDTLSSHLEQLRDDMRTARAHIATLQHDLAVERVEHEETREQVAALRAALAEITPHDGTPVVPSPDERHHDA